MHKLSTEMNEINRLLIICHSSRLMVSVEDNFVLAGVKPSKLTSVKLSKFERKFLFFFQKSQRGSEKQDQFGGLDSKIRLRTLFTHFYL